MVTIKLKFRPKDKVSGEGQVVITVSERGISRQISTAHRIMASEWDTRRGRIRIPDDFKRAVEAGRIKAELDRDISRIRRIVSRFEESGRIYGVDDVIDEYVLMSTKYSLFNFMGELSDSMRKCGRVRTSETYRAAMMSFSRFRAGVDMPIDSITADMMAGYEAYLRSSGLTANTSSFYMRILRAVYNKAVERGVACQEHPFRHVYTGVEKTRKRALPLDEVRRLRSLDLSGTPELDYARDIFMLSFYTRGMSLIDMAYLRKGDLSDGYIVYRRQKTGQRLYVEWTTEMQHIVDKYASAGSPFLFPILKNDRGNIRMAYRNAAYRINRSLKRIAPMIGWGASLTLYCARHSWASIAQTKKIPISVISAGMGHNSEATTRIYLASIDHSEVDRANNIILKALR